MHAHTHTCMHTHVHTHTHTHTFLRDHALWLDLYTRENKKDLDSFAKDCKTIGVQKGYFPPQFVSPQIILSKLNFKWLQILQGAVDLRKDRNQFYLELLHELVSESSRIELESHLLQISCPVQVVWGQQDEVGRGGGR